MRFSPIAVAVAAAFLSFGTIAQDKKQDSQAGQAPSATQEQKSDRSASGSTSAPSASASAGSHNPEMIKQVQSKLNVTADGRWGAQSQKALKDFQTSKGLNATGELDQKTIAALGVGESAAAGSSTTEQKPQNPPAPPAKVEGEKKY